MRKTRRISGWVLAAAVATLGAASWVSPAAAQQRVGSDGRALDANNRIGSGGINDAPARGPVTGVQGNQIVTGNVTAGQQFRGLVPYTDPFAFRGTTGGVTSDRFIRESAGVPIPGMTVNNNAGFVQPFYGESQTAVRPPGYALEAPGTGYIPAPRLSREAGDLRLGRPFDTPEPMIPQPGQLVLPGPVDPSTQQQTVITASPLYGVRQWNFAERADQDFLYGLNMPASQRARLDERTLQRLREELDRDVLQGDELRDEEGLAPAQRDRRTDALNNTFDSRSLSLSLSESARMQDRLTGSPQTQVRPGDLSINRAERQSAQYAEMQRRYNRFNQLPEAVAQWEEFRREQARARGEQDAEAVARGPRPAEQREPDGGRTTMPPLPGDEPRTGPEAQRQPTQPPAAPGTGLPDYAQRSKDILAGKDAPSDESLLPGLEPGRTPADQPRTDEPREQPMQVSSLATGVKTKALSDFLQEAESLMREGKFYSALDQYEMADQVAPNDPMVNLGRAIAELGASYYARAEQHLREAFTRNPALLMAQYDLKGFLGQERLEFLINDLRAISNKETNEPRSVFLLAFIDYNTGNPRRAAAYLDLAERRADRPDPLYQSMRKHWNLPPAQDSGGESGVNK